MAEYTFREHLDWYPPETPIPDDIYTNDRWIPYRILAADLNEFKNMFTYNFDIEDEIVDAVHYGKIAQIKSDELMIGVSDTAGFVYDESNQVVDVGVKVLDNLPFIKGWDGVKYTQVSSCCYEIKGTGDYANIYNEDFRAQRGYTFFAKDFTDSDTVNVFHKYNILYGLSDLDVDGTEDLYASLFRMAGGGEEIIYIYITSVANKTNIVPIIQTLLEPPEGFPAVHVIDLGGVDEDIDISVRTYVKKIFSANGYGTDYTFVGSYFDESIPETGSYLLNLWGGDGAGGINETNKTYRDIRVGKVSIESGKDISSDNVVINIGDKDTDFNVGVKWDASDLMFSVEGYRNIKMNKWISLDGLQNRFVNIPFFAYEHDGDVYDTIPANFLGTGSSEVLKSCLYICYTGGLEPIPNDISVVRYDGAVTFFLYTEGATDSLFDGTEDLYVSLWDCDGTKMTLISRYSEAFINYYGLTHTEPASVPVNIGGDYNGEHSGEIGIYFKKILSHLGLHVGYEFVEDCYSIKVGSDTYTMVYRSGESGDSVNLSDGYVAFKAALVPRYISDSGDLFTMTGMVNGEFAILSAASALSSDKLVYRKTLTDFWTNSQFNIESSDELNYNEIGVLVDDTPNLIYKDNNGDVWLFASGIRMV